MKIQDIFNNYTFQIVVLGGGILGFISGILGSFIILKKESLLGDGVAHSALPGLVLAFVLTGSKRMEILLLGGLISGVLAIINVYFIKKYSKIKFDSSLAITIASFFGFGMVLLGYIQKTPGASQAGIDRFIFGQIATILKSDLKLVAYTGIIILLLVVVFWKEFKLIIFDMEFAKTLNLPVKLLDFILSFLIVVGIIIGLEMVGVVLMSSMLIAPSVAARQWTNKLETMVILSGTFGFISGAVGTLISTYINGLPTGPVIVIVASILAFLSLLISPDRGILKNLIIRRRLRKNILREIDENEFPN